MTKSIYTVEDIKEFLQQEYDLDWINYEIIKNGHKVCIKDKQLKSSLRALFIVYRGKIKEFYTVSVSNEGFSVYGKTSQHKSKHWRKFLVEKYNQVQANDNIL